MFLHVSVILLTGGVSRETPPGTKENPPGTRHTPPDQGEPPRDQAHPPGPRRTPPGPGTPPRPRRTPPGPRHPPPDQGEPPREEHCSIRSMSGRYASYWNAFLFGTIFVENCMEMKEISPQCPPWIRQWICMCFV